MAKSINWLKIKNDYINSNTSYRKLAEKYNISLSSIKQKAKEENWVDLRKKQCHKIATKVTQKTTEKIVEKEVDRIANLLELSDDISNKLKKAITQVESVVVDEKIVDVGMVDTYRLRQIVQSVKDLKDIIGSDKDAKKDDSINIKLNWKRE